MNAKYRGIIVDRLENNNHKTKWHTSWIEAHLAAANLAKRLGLYNSVRYTIRVVDDDGNVI